MKTASTSFLPVLATMSLCVCIAPAARADRAENAFVVVEGDGVVRVDGKNFAVLGLEDGEEATVTVTAQPGWTLLSPSRLKVQAGSPVLYKTQSKSMEEKINGEMTIIRIELTGYDCRHDSTGNPIPWNAKAEGPVPENEEGEGGAVIHWNIDNDDDSTGGTSEHPGMDAVQIGPIANEDDLKKLRCELYPEELSVGMATLSVDSSNGVIWKGRGKGRHNLLVRPGGSKTWNLEIPEERQTFRDSIKKLFVEGVGSGTSSVTFEYVLNQKRISDTIRYTFVAANCGSQPTSTQKSLVRGLSNSSVVGCEWSVLEEASGNYNCFAHSVGEKTLWIGTIYDGIQYGDMFIDRDFGNNNGALEEQDIKDFYAAYGYSACSPELADVIVYRRLHASRRKTSNCPDERGMWVMFESKLGQNELIEHVREQFLYGNPILYFAKTN